MDPIALTAYLCWSEEQVDGILGDEIPKVFLGGFLPAMHPGQRLDLGGDYPQLFEHLRDFQKSNTGPFYVWADSGGGICPTSTDEPCGMLYGSVTPGECRVLFFFDKESARMLFAVLTAEDPYWGPIADKTRPFLERSTLPETGGRPVLELDPHAARWLSCWYFLYQHVVGQIR